MARRRLAQVLGASHIADGAEEVTDMRDVNPAPSRLPSRNGAQKAENLRCRHARDDVIYFRVAHGAIAVDDEDGRLRDAALLPRVVDIPLLNDAPFGVAQNRKREPQLAPHCFRFRGRIDGYGRDAGPGRGDFCVVVAVIRQLAEAKRSPIAAIEEQHERPVRN
jgi:hypothetical protein